MDYTDPNAGYWDAMALQAARRHPLMMAAWHIADVTGNLAIRLQDAIEARMRQAVDAP